MSIRHRLILGFGCILVLMSLVVFSTGSEFARTRSIAEEVTDRLIPQVSAANALQMSADRQRSALRSYTLTGQQRFYDEYRAALKAEEDVVRELRQKLTDPDDKALLKDLQSDLTELHYDGSRTLSILSASGKDAAFTYHQSHVRPLAEEVSMGANKLGSEGLDRIDEAIKEFDLSMGRLVIFTRVSLAAALLLALAFLIGTIRSVSRSARNMAQAYEKIALAEEQARADREWLRAVIDTMPEGVIVAAAPDGRILMANETALALYGLDSVPDAEIPEHARAFHLFRPNRQSMRGEDLPLSRSLLKGEACSGEEILILQPSGKEVVVLCSTVPIKDSRGEITSAIGVFQDITVIKEQQRMLQQTYEHQRNIAESLQKSFLPSVHPKVAGYEIADAYVPAQADAEVGGDFYDLIELGEGMLGIVIGDVSGKGVEAAVHTAMAKYMLRGFAHENPEPAALLTRLNAAVTRYVHGEIFVTLFYCVLHTGGGKIVYANAGHERPLLFRAESGKCIALESTGPAVGVIPDGKYTQVEMKLSEGDAFVMYTDGITEARQGKEFLGQSGLEQLVMETADASAHEMTGKILARVREYADGNLRDDIALLVIKSGRSE